MPVHLGSLARSVERLDYSAIQSDLIDVLSAVPVEHSIGVLVEAVRRGAPRVLTAHPVDTWIVRSIAGHVEIPPEYPGPGEGALAAAIVLLNAARDPRRSTSQRLHHLAEGLCSVASAAGWAAYGAKYPAEWNASFERASRGGAAGKALLMFLDGEATDPDAQQAERQEWKAILESIGRL